MNVEQNTNNTSTVELFYASLGKPSPAPLTEEEKAEFEREMDDADRRVAERQESRV